MSVCKDCKSQILEFQEHRHSGIEPLCKNCFRARDKMVLCPYHNIPYENVPGYVSGYGCPVCKGIGESHLLIDRSYGMFEVGTKFWFGERLFRIDRITFESKPFPQPCARFWLYLDEYRADGQWVNVGEFADITPNSLVDGLRTGNVKYGQ